MYLFLFMVNELGLSGQSAPKPQGFSSLNLRTVLHLHWFWAIKCIASNLTSATAGQDLSICSKFVLILMYSKVLYWKIPTLTKDWCCYKAVSPWNHYWGLCNNFIGLWSNLSENFDSSILNYYFCLLMFSSNMSEPVPYWKVVL